jgi:hypothetical protein
MKDENMDLCDSCCQFKEIRVYRLVFDIDSVPTEKYMNLCDDCFQEVPFGTDWEIIGGGDGSD